MKFGRNELCWCGSGKKFKRCHLERHKLTPFNLEEIHREIKKKSDIRLCFAKNSGLGQCSSEIVKAHSLSKKASLERIARKQHIYGFRGSKEKAQQENGLFLPKFFPKLIGIREASTFTGFCQKHDCFLFKSLDTNSFLPTEEQITLLMYRVLCREIMWKMKMGNNASLMREADRGMTQFVQTVVQHNASQFDDHVSQMVPNLQHEQEKLQRIIRNRVFENISYVLIRFDSVTNLICAGLSQPNIDFKNRMLLDLNLIGTRQDNVVFALLPGEIGAVAVFAWIGYFSEAEEFVGSLLNLPESRISNQLVRYAFETFDNVWMSPDWWENLPKPEQDFLIERMNIGCLPYFSVTGDPYSLQDNEMDFVDWKITETKTCFSSSTEI